MSLLFPYFAFFLFSICVTEYGYLYDFLGVGYGFLDIFGTSQTNISLQHYCLGNGLLWI